MHFPLLFGLLVSGGAPIQSTVVDVATAGLVVAVVVNYTKYLVKDLASKIKESQSDQDHTIQLYVWFVALIVTLLSMLQDGTLTGTGIAQNVEPILATSLLVAGVAIGTYNALTSDSIPGLPGAVPEPTPAVTVPVAPEPAPAEDPKPAA